MWIEVPTSWDKVSKEVFEEVLEEIDYRRVYYSNAIEYRGKQAMGETFGYETNKGDYYLVPEILGGAE